MEGNPNPHLEDYEGILDELQPYDDIVIGQQATKENVEKK